MNNNKRLKQRITALTLASTLVLSACANKDSDDHFDFIENKNNKLIVMDDDYISNDAIHKFYVLEVCNRVTKIFEAIKEIYVFENSDSLKKKRIIDYMI